MFFKTLKNIKKRLELDIEALKQEREFQQSFLEKWKRDQKQAINDDIRDHMFKAHEQGLKESLEFECEWHSKREEKMTELAKIDAKIEERTRLMETFSFEPMIKILNNLSGQPSLKDKESHKVVI